MGENHSKTAMKRVVIIVTIVLLFFIFLAPGMDREVVRDIVIDNDNGRGAQIPPGCDYQVFWAPFGRWAASCENGHYVLFPGFILF